MSNELINKEDASPAIAKLQDGEAVLPKLTEESKAAVEELVGKYSEMVDQLEDDVEKVESILDEITEGLVVEEAKAVKPESKAAKPKAAKKKDDEKIVAVFSTKNVTWNGVGKVYRGYNIVTQEEADQWATRSHIRIATPEEVAQEFGL